jgi:IS30 family transposase
MKRPTVVTIRLRNEMRAARTEGQSLQAIADWSGLHKSVVHRHVRDIPPPRTGWYPRKVPHERVLALRAAGLGVKEIADQYGVTGPAISHIVRRHKSKIQQKAAV